ncbi:efflux RND transporter periplasmic adaptor subunit [Thalassolituus hydrocarboniclasticus]|uniref:Efflux RND transporter periplasmic adaptor subunit n=1 Tax=Thalassolituus hydrocarboniclasticus TaxID=2742796 RepID=A0ABY6A7I7_9GAMM|nr:efflux RND transporter periplasmic adaptor subunit [Thalassolituus hydrocarboniclasticus]UXD86743.1 efflux RND transporter periplasmic adaptor subunit [Thalassolituus hydrocarboniclasticus]
MFFLRLSGGFAGRSLFACLTLILAAPLLAQPALPVETVSVQWQEYARPLRISGVLENKSEQNLAFKINGLVRRVAVDEGQWVKAGQVLAALDLEEIDAQVAKAESVLANAERNLARFQSLQGLDALSVEQLQSAETQVDVARSDLTVARFNQRHAVIRAPADGRVLKRSVEANEMVSNGKPVFLFAARTSGWVLRAGVTDKDIVRLRLQDHAEVTFDAYPGAVFQAELSELAGRADASQTFEIELRVTAKPEQPLLAGFVGHAVIMPAQTRPAVLLPVGAMVRTYNKHSAGQSASQGAQAEVEVFVVQNNDGDYQAQLRRLPLLALDHDQLVITGGLQDGEDVVVAGAPYLSDGRAVMPVNNVVVESATIAPDVAE